MLFQPALGPEEFASLVVDAVAHLYDQPFLQTHQLGHVLVTEPGGSLRGRALQQTLLETIRELKPPPGALTSPHAWRTYRYLFLRYVQALPVAEVARDLGISERQARRTYREAIDALTSVLWDRYRERCQLTPAPERVDPSLLSDEVHHLAASHQNESTDLVEVLAGLRSIVEPLAAQHGCTWSTTLAEKLGTIQGNRVVVRQILLNLCVAAIDRGAATLHLSATQEAEWIRIALVGSGEGRAPVQPIRRRGAFDAQRLEISRLLVEAQGGTFETRSSEAGSMTCVVCLPSSRRPTVLVVDDNPEIRTVFRRYLESAGTDVLTAESGTQGFELAKEFRPVAVTLDVMMASQDGWETLQLLRNHPATHDIPVLICSVLRDAELSRFLGASELLPKPIHRSELLAALDRCGVPGLARAGQSSS